MQPVTLAKPSEATVPDTLPFVSNYSAKEQAIGAVARIDRPPGCKPRLLEWKLLPGLVSKFTSAYEDVEAG